LDARILDVNRCACDSLQYSREQLLTLRIEDVAALDDGPEWSVVLSRLVSEAVTIEGTHRRADQSTYPVELRLGLLHLGGQRLVLGLARDITARREASRERGDLELQLRRSQKMEAVGRLAGGIAHDFNNLLTTILGSTELSLLSLNGTPEDRAELPTFLADVQGAAERAASLTRQLLVFSRGHVPNARVLQLNDVLRDMGRLLGRLISEDIHLVLELAPDLDRVTADVGQLEQVLVNLVVNAQDAMPRGGLLTIETRNVVDAEAPGRQILLVVSDTGTGIGEEHLSRIFEPFYTTKPVGEGTGLGLATVFAVVQGLGGRVEVRSEVGRGTSFELFLPATQAPVEVLAVPDLEEVSGGRETILLCEDEGPVRALAARMLSSAGYRVLVAETPQDAIDLADEHGEGIGLLLTDVIMPGMDGLSLSLTVASRIGGAPPLFVSGYTADVLAQRGLIGERVDLLDKPFTRGQLLRHVRRILDREIAEATEVRPAVS
jgi:PAS domain S-box-containing protein